MSDPQGISVKQARAAMARALSEDDGFYLTYEAAIAMYLHDRDWLRTQDASAPMGSGSKRSTTQHNDRNKAAEDLLNLLFAD